MSNKLNSIAEDLIYFGQETLSQLKNNLKLVPTVRRNYGTAEAEPGSVIQVPTIDIAGSANDRVVGGAVTADDVSSGFVKVTVGQIYKATQIDNLSRTFSNVDLMAEVAGRLAYPMAAKADAKVADSWIGTPFECGTTDGTSFFNATDDINSLAKARKILMDNQAPVDQYGSVHHVMSTSDSLGLRQLDSYKRVNWAGTADGRMRGALGDIYGIDLYESQQIATATLTTSASWGTPLVNGAATAGAATLAIKGLGTGSIKKGTGFKVGSAYYTATADATITSNAATVTLNKPLAANASDGDAVTPYVAGHSAAGAMGLVYHSDGILAVARASAPFYAGSGVTSVVVSDDQTGLSIRLSHQSTLVGNPGMVESLVADFIFGTQVIRPEFVVKATGKV